MEDRNLSGPTVSDESKFYNRYVKVITLESNADFDAKNYQIDEPILVLFKDSDDVHSFGQVHAVTNRKGNATAWGEGDAIAYGDGSAFNFGSGRSFNYGNGHCFSKHNDSVSWNGGVCMSLNTDPSDHGVARSTDKRSGSLCLTLKIGSEGLPLGDNDH